MKRLIAVLLLFTATLVAKAPELEPRDVRMKLKEIMRSHARHKELDPVLVGRALENFLEQLDPGKTYLTEKEIVKWTNPSDKTLQTAMEGYRTANFDVFEEMHATMVAGIDRRTQIEASIDMANLPKNVKASEFRDMKWAADERALEERIVRLRAIQMEVAEKLNTEDRTLSHQRLEKRRLRQEEKLLGTNATDRQRLMLAYVLKATANALDTQTAYFTPEEAVDFMIQLQQRLFGIGVQLRDSLDGFSIVRVLEGGPAYRDGSMRVDDMIVAVDGEYVVGMDILDVVQLIRGQAGTPVNLTLLRDDETVDLELVRDEVVLKETRIETASEEVEGGIIGRIALHSFYQDAKFSSTGDVTKAIKELKSQGNLKGLILDLRYNSGGLLPQAIGVTGLFIKKGIVCSIKDNQGRVQHLRNTDEKVAWDGPLVILVSRGSASASEIVAQALQDYGRAIVIGDPTTFGKGTFQTSTLDAVHGKHVNPKGEFKVTRGAYYTVSGKSPQLKGVKSDVIAPGPLSELEIGECYAKYPLEPDSIGPHFEDDLSDIPFIHRAQARRLYLFNIQEPMNRYTQHIPSLRGYSERRINSNPDYQALLTSLKNRDEAPEPGENQDLQLIECTNIVKDLILLDSEYDSSSTHRPLSHR